jgi:AcrR family transcriptional regulator
MCNNSRVARKYELKRRAETQAETRRRIVEAAIQLHRTKGPARTTFSDIARLAGVQRHTLYRHFPDERELGLACSGLYLDENPPPSATAWRSIDDPAARLRRGLSELYSFYETAEDMLTCLLRDAPIHPLTRELFELRAGPSLAEVRSALAEPLRGRRALAALDLALDFHSWRRLTDSGLSRSEAVETMVAAILGQ